jgi:hypothetical protein
MRSTRPRRRFALLLSSSLAAALAACSSSGGSSGGNVVIHDANNYSSTSSLTIPVVTTAEKTDLTFTWDMITKDLLCHTAGAIDNVGFLMVTNTTMDMVEQEAAHGQLNPNNVAKYGEQHTATAGDGGTPATSASLSKFYWYDTFNPLTDYVAAPNTQYMMLFTHGTALGVGAQSMVFISPDPNSTNTMVAGPNPCPDGTSNGTSEFLAFSATLSAMPVSIPLKGPWKIDWSQVTKDNFGITLGPSLTLDTVKVGFFQNQQPSQIEADFLNVEQDATALYTFNVPKGQKYVDLMEGEADGGGTFPGFTETDGTWAVAVFSSADSVPAPLIFAVLQPQ